MSDNKVNLGKMKASACKELDGYLNEANNCMVDDKKPPKNSQKPSPETGIKKTPILRRRYDEESSDDE